MGNIRRFVKVPFAHGGGGGGSGASRTGIRVGELKQTPRKNIESKLTKEELTGESFERRHQALARTSRVRGKVMNRLRGAISPKHKRELGKTARSLRQRIDEIFPVGRKRK